MSNESVDKHVRQALDSLPDTPPPGSTFDAGTMWKTLQAELHPKPRRHWAGWWVAACLVLASAGSFLLKSTDGPYPLEKSANVHRAKQVQVPSLARSRQSEAPGIVAKAVPVRPKSIRQQPPLLIPMPTSQPEAETVPLLEVPPLSEPAPVVEVAATSPAARAVPIPTRPRFRVLHINELRAEEEARPKLYRSEGLVRVIFGTPHGAEPAAQEPIKSVTFSTKPKTTP